MKNRIITSSLALLGLTFGVGLYGATHTWTGSGDIFNDPDNWNTAPNFNLTNTYIFSSDLGTKTIELSGNVQNAGIQINSTFAGDLTFDLKTYSLNMNSTMFLRSQSGSAIDPTKVTFK